MKKNRKLIPKGLYCYHVDKVSRNGFRIPCPYWKLDTIHTDKQENGYCEYLKKSDWDINEEYGDVEWIKSTGEKHVTYPHEFPMSLLWDQCKMCGIND